ncbi:MAG: PQQ-binding-like beta-propeller repeat protein [Chloroflexota bacterium]
MKKETVGLSSQVAHRGLGVNWSLLLGGAIVAFFIFLYVRGPKLAPKDPLATPAMVVQVDGKWLLPPFPFFTPGYPLGSDTIGRDLFSRILWGIRPTFTLVVIIATVRLVLGTVIGLIAGWSERWIGRLSDTAISAALAVPVIMVALGGIAAVGVDLGIWAFIVGLSVTGWVDTARMVREQTAAVRGQVYIEAAKALGASQWQLLNRHVLRQVLPMIWMLFAFEISGTLMLVAALGFLGYYIGGDIWVQVTDATAVATTGMPELGQMLATTGARITQPWSLIAVGVVIFTAVLGFNLLGEGLRQRLRLYRVRRHSVLSGYTYRLQLWLDENVLWPFSKVARMQVFRYVFVIALLSVVLAFGWSHIRGWIQPLFFSVTFTPLLEGDEPLWATERGDPMGTRGSRFVGPEEGDIAWVFEDTSGFTGGPVVGADGTVYVTSNGSRLYALSPDAEVLWQLELQATPVGTPSLSAEGRIYVSDKNGGLSAITSAGKLLWYVPSENNRAATAGPVVSPSTGAIFYPTGSFLRAISAEGELLWEVNALMYGGGLHPPQLSPDGSMLFFENVALKAGDGNLLGMADQVEVDEFIVGADGQTYLREGNNILKWDETVSGFEVTQTITWDYMKFTTSSPQTGGVTPDNIIWLFYSSFARSMGLGEDTRLVWLNGNGQVIGNVHYSTRDSQVIAVDGNNTVYSCGNLEQGYGAPECQAFSPQSELPLWRTTLDGHSVAGGALAPDRLYVTTKEGYLHAIGEGGYPPLQPGGIAQVGTPEKMGVEEGQPQATSSAHLGPAHPEVRLIFEHESSFVSAPVLLDDDKVLMAANNGELFALDAHGGILWKVTLPGQPVGTPVLGTAGELYITDKLGLSAYTPSGELIWRYQPESGKSVGGPTIGPKGVIYYTLEIASKGYIQAVSPDGEPLWRSEVKAFTYYQAPQAAPGIDFVFFRSEAFKTSDGSLLDFGFPFKVDRFIIGADGNTYLQARGTVVRWQETIEGIELSEDRVLSSEGLSTATGVTPLGQVWMLGFGTVYWFEGDGEAIGVYVDQEMYLSSVMGIDQDLRVYVCGRSTGAWITLKCKCLAVQPNMRDPVWKVTLRDEFDEFTGGVVSSGKMFVATEAGYLFLLEDPTP